MGRSVRNLLDRLSGASLDEVKTRLFQEMAKQADYARFRIGFRGQNLRLLPSPDPAPKFFFSPSDLPERVGLLKQHLPSAVEDTVREADEILQHRFGLLGYRDLDYGKDIDWHLDAVHGKRAPLKPWYQIRFLNFDEVGDHKITWELNRHQHFVTLAKAWAFTRCEKYVREIVSQVYSWGSANPYPLGINWGSSLEVAFRSLSWLWVRSLLRDATGLPESFDRELLLGLARHGRYVDRYLSTYFSPNTHLIGEAVALFFIGTLCPEIPSARRWQEKGLSIVLAEAEKQVHDDGVYFEQSLYYHVYALDFFLHTRALASCNGIPMPAKFDSVINRMLLVLRALSWGGPPEGFGDDDGGRLFNARRNRAEHMTDPLALGAAMFRTNSFRSSTLPTEEAIWIFGDAAIPPSAPDEDPQFSGATAFPNGGLYVMADHNARMVIDSGRQGTGSSGHGHADALGISFSVNGQRFLVDSGSFVYIPGLNEAGARDKFRGTAAHNTIRVDNVDQAIPHRPFSWRALPNVVAEKWTSGRGFTVFSGRHDGYSRLNDPVLHRRMIFHLHDDYWLVRDHLEGQTAHDVELFLHFAPALRAQVSDLGITAYNQDGNSLQLLCSGSERWDVVVEDGWVSPAYGEKQGAQVGRIASRIRLPAEHGALLLPGGTGRRSTEFHFANVGTASLYSYESEDFHDSIIFADSHSTWQLGDFRSDAKFLFSRTENGELTILVSCSASFLERHGHSIFRCEKPCDWMTWRKNEGVYSSSPELIKVFKEEALRSRTAVP